ncbi:MAG: polar amino acid transport system substrate-binding protein [Solirubrobacterales bacterium]|jgi:polar amino acid transport system substrate-binding protein|nr:polar amino acid transport system substrate-binding protein [Solirubrobacterales bacterium]
MSRTRLSALFALLLVAVVALVAAGCGSDDDTTAGGTETSASTEGGGEGLEPLTVGSDIPYPPFEDFGPNKEPVGFDIELLETIAEDVGRKAEFQDTSFDTIFRDLAQGRFEAVASATTITDEREETVDFTNPYYFSEQAILVKEGGDIGSVEALSGVTVGVQQGTTGEEFVEEKTDAGELRKYPQGPDAVNALKTGVVDAVVIDIPVAENAVEKAGGIEISAAIPTEEEYGFVVQQGDTELLEDLNAALETAKDNGTFSTIYEKWFKRPPTAALLKATHEAS